MQNTCTESAGNRSRRKNYAHYSENVEPLFIKPQEVEVFSRMPNNEWASVRKESYPGRIWVAGNRPGEAFLQTTEASFILFSSISGIVGNPGQTNYASANTFLDAFVQFRHGNGLPASVMDVGAMGEVGYVSQNMTIMAQLKAGLGYILQEQDLLDSIELAIKRSRRGAEVHSDGYLN